MRTILFAVAIIASGCVATVPKAEGIRSTIDVTPKNAPGLGGGYEFDLLEAVEGAACVEWSDVNSYYATIPGFEPTKGDPMAARAEGAALYDAMGKAVGADTLLVTWVKITGEGTKKCATVHARGVKLRMASQPPAAPANEPAAPAPQKAPASSEKPTTAAAAAPSS